MRVNRFIKIFVFSSVTVLVVFIMLIAKHYALENMFVENNFVKGIKLPEVIDNINTSLKYILLWTRPADVPFVYMGKGRQGFIEKKCPVTNCFVTGDRNYLDDYTKFDAVAFHGPEVRTFHKNELPQKRSSFQKYIFASIESAHNYPVCEKVFDNFFNWTWTYRLNSDARWGYIAIRDKNGKIIGPNEVMHWIDIDHMDNITDDIRKKLKSKSVAVAWFVSHCQSRSYRKKIATRIHIELKKYGLRLDIYGECGKLNCSRSELHKCRELIQKKYYFIFAFENSFSEDYVTEKVLNGLQNYAVPVVYGKANYTRFMPNGIYLNALALGPQKIAATMNELIKDPRKYEKYFKWHNHYSFHDRMESIETNDYCRFCEMLNNETLTKTTTVYEHFRDWWNTEHEKMCYYKFRKNIHNKSHTNSHNKSSISLLIWIVKCLYYLYSRNFVSH